tara:strand:+ start:197 stop:406 length:210 start_codon:yes stop_codon:yes gene_type:complete
MILFFCVTLFAHSEHYAQVKSDDISIFELHDCYLYQQDIDPPPKALALYPTSRGGINICEVSIINATFI